MNVKILGVLAVLPLGAAFVGIGEWLQPQRSRGQEQLQPPGAERPAADAPAAHRFLGVERCEDCHYAPTPRRVEQGVTDFVLLTESKIWLSDIHSRAYELIDPEKSELSRQICDTLGIQDISRAQECLSCHSNWLKDHARPRTFDRGVACESCHGPSSAWDLPHTEETWRAKPVAEKEALGMIDVRDPVKRAEQCFSCHIGNVPEGKVITHAMYAAGHPPLPSIEIESFATRMPPHWRYLDEKPEFKLRDEFIRENMPYLLSGEAAGGAPVVEHHQGAAAVVLGGAMALRQSLELAAALAQDEQRAWPELSAFDCTACHHDLRSPSWRQRRGFAGRPGRPMLHEWPASLVNLAVLHVSPDRPSYERKRAELDRRLAGLREPLDVRPFGSPESLVPACSELSEWLTAELIAPLAAKPFDQAAVRRSLTMLIRTGQNDTLDYHSARQVAWAIRALYCELKPAPPRDAEVRQLLRAVSEELGLDPNSAGDFCRSLEPAPEPRPLTPLADQLPATLNRLGAYDPQSFQAHLRSLAQLLAAR